MTLLGVRGLRTRVRSGGGAVEIVRGVDLSVDRGETVALVGESGSGKSFTVMSLVGLLPRGAEAYAGAIDFDGDDLRVAPERRLREIRGAKIGMIYQDSLSALNPMMTVADQILEGLRAHGWARAVARARVGEVLHEVGIPNPTVLGRCYPHQLSGGMRQRVLIASAIAARPSLLIADEATTALDVTIQRQILQLVQNLAREYEMAVLWVTHDLGVVAEIADRVVVMYAGRAVEITSAEELFRAPRHPYTAGLLGALPTAGHPHQASLLQIGGVPVSLSALPSGCPFEPRCSFVSERCVRDEPPLDSTAGTAVACWNPLGAAV